MDSFELINEANVNRWWWLKRMQYNKGLLIGGAVTYILCVFVATAFINPINDYTTIGYASVAFAALYLIYMVVANALFTLGWVADIAFNRNNDDSFRDIIFTCGYWLSVLFPTAVILVYIAIFFTAVPQLSL